MGMKVEKKIMTDDKDSLKSVIPEFNGGKLAKRIEKEYSEILKPETLMGEPIEDGEFKDVSQGMRKYTFGDASDRKVLEHGVKVVFDPDNVDLSRLQKGGDIRREILQLSQTILDSPVKKVDLSDVTRSEYILWIIVEN